MDFFKWMYICYIADMSTDFVITTTMILAHFIINRTILIF